MDAKELVECLKYNRERLIDERGADFSGVKALDAAIKMFEPPKYNTDDSIMGYLLKEAQEVPEIYNKVGNLLYKLFREQFVPAEITLLCTYCVKKMMED